MTEKLKTLMHERADQVAFAVPDLDAVRAAGTRRRRRRRAGVTGAGLVAVVAVGALFVTLTDTPSDDAGPDVATEPGRVPTGTTWATGTVIHDSNGATLDTGHRVVTYVATTSGFVTTDDEGAVWSVTGGDSGPVVEQVGSRGTTDDVDLAADPDDSRVAWVDAGVDPGGPQLVVLDQATGVRENVLGPLGPLAPAADDAETTAGEVYALDDGVLYARAGAEAFAIDLADGAATVVHPDVTRSDDVIDAAAGVVAFGTDDGEDAQVRLGATRAAAGQPFAGTFDGGYLSPDAAYLASSDDEGDVLDTATGAPVVLDVTGFYEVYGWSGDRVADVIAENDSGGARLMTCQVPAGTCTDVVPDLGSFDDLGDEFALPVGAR